MKIKGIIIVSNILFLTLGIAYFSEGKINCEVNNYKNKYSFDKSHTDGDFYNEFVENQDSFFEKGNISGKSNVQRDGKGKGLMKAKKTKAIVIEDWEDGNMSKFPWVLNGDANFHVVTENPYEGNFCVKSGDIGNWDYSRISVTLNVLFDGNISFYRKVSSESGYDFLRFYIDETFQNEWSGESDWQQFSYPVSAGTHTFKWIYIKDGNTSSGSDCGWIDYISFPPILQFPTNLDGLLNYSTGEVSLNWKYNDTKDLQYFKVYRDDVVIGTTTDTSYTDILSSYGIYQYKVSAFYDDGESLFSNVDTVSFIGIEVVPTTLDFGIVLVGDSSVQQIVIFNQGLFELSGIISTPAGYEVMQGKFGFNIPSFGSDTFNVKFSPELDQYYIDSIIITHDGGGSDKIINVSGEGSVLVSPPYLESFETGFGEWDQSIDDDFDWTRSSGSTYMSNTGPDSAVDGNYYLYTEYSLWNTYVDYGLKEGFDFSAVSFPFISFEYHMYGIDMGELKLQISLNNENSWATLWSKAGDQGNSWHQAGIDLSAFAGQTNVILRILGTRGGYYSDIAIDRIYVYNNLDKAENLEANLDIFTSKVSLTWDYSGAGTMQYFNIYRNDSIIGTTTGTAYSDSLTAFGTYEYKITAVHAEGESLPSNVETLNFSAVTPINLVAALDGLTSEVILNWEFDPFFQGYAICEDFQDGEADNFIFQDDRFSISNGYLEMNGNSNSTWASAYYDEIFSDFILEFEVIRDQSLSTQNVSMGVFIRSNGYINYSNANGYAILFTSDGEYSVWEFHNGNTTPIYNWHNNSYINTSLGVSNIITIKAIGSYFKIYINGNYVNSFSDASYSSGYITLCTYDSGNGSNKVRFDNVFLTTENQLNGKEPIIPIAKPVSNKKGKAEFSNLSPIINPYIQPIGLINKTIAYQTKAFQKYNIYRNEVLIGFAMDTTFTDTLSAFGTYKYRVSAKYDEGESLLSKPAMVVHTSMVPNNLTAYFDSVNTTVSLNWRFDNSKAFQQFNIYRNNTLIGTSSDTVYTDTLTNFGDYDYKITAQYDEGESGSSNIETVVYTSISVSCSSLDFGKVTTIKDSTQQFIITNIGNNYLIGGISTPTGFIAGTGGKNTLSYIIPPLSADTFNITFAPDSSNFYSGNVVITHNTAGPDKTIALNGEGVLVFTLPYNESFESDFGGWEFSDDDDDDWTRYSGPTPDYGTGPSSAYDGLYYLYTDVINNSNLGLEANFSFENVTSPIFSFWYHMYGSSIGTLKVQISTDNGDNWTDIWSLSGNQGNQWNNAQIDLSAYSNLFFVKIRFWGISGSYSNIAIDLIELWSNIYAPYNLTSSLNSTTGEVNLNWDFDGGKEFLNYNIYRDNVLIGTSLGNSYIDTLPAYGSYDYYVKALYNSGESNPSNIENVFWDYTDFTVSPNEMSANLVAGNTTTQIMTIADIGGVGLDYSLCIQYLSGGKGKTMSIEAVRNQVIQKSGILNGPITTTTYNILYGKEVQSTIYSAEYLVRVVYGNSKSNLDIGILGAEDSEYLNDVQNKLIATGEFASITAINVRYYTPSLLELQAFDAVLVWSNYLFSDNVTLGDNLADYVDSGGGVVTAIFEANRDSNTPYHLSGRWEADNYIVLKESSLNSASDVIGTFDATHPIMNNVGSFSGTIKPGSFKLTPGASIIASWSSSMPLVAVKVINTHKRVDLGMWPVSSDVYSGGWDSSTNGAILIANALKYSVGDSGWLSVNPQSGTIIGNEAADIDVEFNATDLEPGSYTAEIMVSTSLKAQSTVPVTLNVLHPMSVDIKVFIEGPYLGGLLIPYLNIFNYIPLNQPYNVAPWNYQGTESVTAIPNADVVDWILVELRETSGDASTATSSTTIGYRAGFILKDGKIVDTDGLSPLLFTTAASQNVFAVIHHRNHLAIMSSTPLSVSANIYSYDFTVDSTQAYGHNSMKEVETGVWSMIGGNALNDKQINNKDKNDVWFIQKDNSGYYNGDLNMNGQIDNSDIQSIWEYNPGYGSHIPN